MSVSAPDRPPVHASAAAMTVRPLSSNVDSRLHDDWLNLWNRAEDAVSWQHPDSVYAECRHLNPSRLSPLFVESRDDHELIGGAILLPKSVRTNHLGGIGPNFTLHGYRLVGGRLLHDQVDANHLTDAVFAAVSQASADFLLIEDIDQPSPLWSSISNAMPKNWQAFTPNGVQARLRIRFRDDGESYWQQFSSKTRSTFRRKLKKFGKTRLELITAADQVSDFLAAAHLISLQTWQSRRLGLRVRNTEAERVVLSALADAGLLRSYLWLADGEPAAFCIGHQSHGVFHYEEVGYATKFARFSPGQMLVVQMIEDLLADNRPDVFDFGGGDADYKRMFANDVSQSGTVWLVPPAWRAKTALQWASLCRAAKSNVRSLANRLGLATRIRQWIRYGGASNQLTTASEEEAAS